MDALGEGSGETEDDALGDGCGSCARKLAIKNARRKKETAEPAISL